MAVGGADILASESSLQTSFGVTVWQARGLRRKQNAPFLMVSLGSRLLWIRVPVATKNWVLVSLCRGGFALFRHANQKREARVVRGLSKGVLWEVSGTRLAWKTLGRRWPDLTGEMSNYVKDLLICEEWDIVSVSSEDRQKLSLNAFLLLSRKEKWWQKMARLCSNSQAETKNDLTCYRTEGKEFFSRSGTQGDLWRPRVWLSVLKSPDAESVVLEPFVWHLPGMLSCQHEA